MLNAPAARLWPSISYVYGLLVVIALGYFLLGTPIQVTDGFTNMLSLEGRSFGSIVYDEFYERSYLRPMLWAHLYVVYALADGSYFEWFRGWHVFQVLLLVVLFVGLFRPRSAIDAAVIPLGLAVLIGMHTFAGTVIEAYPINTFMTILLCCFAAASVALGPYRWWRDAAAAVLFVFAALTVESGLLVSVIFVAAWLAGARGVSRRGIATLSLLLAGYLVLRFLVLDVGSPGLIERSSGYGFSVRDPDELVALFGSNPIGFYVYNVVTSAVSVLVSEPRAGVFRLARGVAEGEVWPYSIVNVVASLLGTALIVRYAWRRRAAWLERRFDRNDQLVVVFVAVLCGNAVISYPYQKDVIMSAAGAFFALAVAVAARDLVLTASPGLVSRAAAGLVLVILSTAWSVRAAAIHLAIRDSALDVRNEWALVDEWLERERPEGLTAAASALKTKLQDEAIVGHPAPPGIDPDWWAIFDPQ